MGQHLVLRSRCQLGCQDPPSEGWGSSCSPHSVCENHTDFLPLSIGLASPSWCGHLGSDSLHTRVLCLSDTFKKHFLKNHQFARVFQSPLNSQFCLVENSITNELLRYRSLFKCKFMLNHITHSINIHEQHYGNVCICPKALIFHCLVFDIFSVS